MEYKTDQYTYDKKMDYVITVNEQFYYNCDEKFNPIQIFLFIFF